MQRLSMQRLSMQQGDDNSYVEALFRTAKYRPDFPSAGFADLAGARQWAAEFVHGYNHEMA